MMFHKPAHKDTDNPCHQSQWELKKYIEDNKNFTSTEMVESYFLWKEAFPNIGDGCPG